MADRGEPAKTGSEKTPATEDVVGLYRRAFAEFGARALWNIKEFEEPTVKQVLAIARQLRTEGDMNARRLAEQTEKAARAHLPVIPDGAMRAAGEQCSDPGPREAGSDSLPEVPDS